MSDVRSAPKEWPSVDLIAGLFLERTAEPESELDEKVHSGRVSVAKTMSHSYNTHSGAAAFSTKDDEEFEELKGEAVYQSHTKPLKAT